MQKWKYNRFLLRDYTKILLMVLILFSVFHLYAQENTLVESQLAIAFQGKSNLTIAVMDFVNVDGKQSVLGRHLAEESINHLLKSPGLRLVDRSQTNQLEKEWRLSDSGLIDEDKVVEIGKMLGADALVIGWLIPHGRRIRVHMRIVDTRTGLLLSNGATELSGSRYRRMYNEILE